MSSQMSPQWWRSAVIYQVYPRSFADGNGDGVGDLAGVRNRLPYLKKLGVDALWFTPWYASPLADGGYDVSDYRAIDPLFGDLEEAERLIAEAHALGIGIIVDIVPNHISDQHVWFQEALQGKGRDRFWFVDEPVNRWISEFGGQPGNVWTQVPDGQWYLHLFDPAQPDLNWTHPEVHAEFEAVLRFWFDRGVDGIRIDSAGLLVKEPDLADYAEGQPHPFRDRDEVHDIYRRWRQIAEEYGNRAFVGEVWMPDPVRFANYLRPDELHTAFNLEFLCCAWDPEKLRQVINNTLDSHAPVGAPATWVLSNHDVTRPVTRYGREDTAFSFATKTHDTPTDLDLGTRRARAAALLMLGLPGSAYIYQGEELGLWEVEDIPADLRQDPMRLRSTGTDPGRDGCRVPLPWSGDQPPFGFSPTDVAKPWLPQPAAWKAYTVEAQTGDPHSMLELYLSALQLRRDFQDADFAWAPSEPDVLAFRRGEHLIVVNLSPNAVELPEHTEVLLTSRFLAGDRLPPDAAVWLRSGS
ncbi:glycoside hydrolase family 13 protein [Catelliglobosispora koreensis]|uniref:glycoside hydrolase family 13 protein n=1 Tax=Catelliglobosispora koreensis TaxID=129052 RepID=UPI00036C44EB|nr:glycoside hydrolase family 13 protein [Catelliglobosispora koreensis]